MIESKPLFRVRFEAHTLVGDIMGNLNPPQTLVLHGAGNSNRGRFQLLREDLAEKGVANDSVQRACIDGSNPLNIIPAISARTLVAL